MLRIIAGKLKGRKLLSLKGKGTRPTLAKNREVIFSVLASRVNLEDYEACDLFAGVGSLGFEAFSRGSSRAVFVEKDKKAFWLLKENIKRLSLENNCRVFLKDALSWLKKQTWEAPPKLFFLDPPYQSELIEKTLQIMELQSHSLRNSLIVAETSKDRHPVYPPSFTVFQQKSLGKTRLDFLTIQDQKIK